MARCAESSEYAAHAKGQAQSTLLHPWAMLIGTASLLALRSQRRGLDLHRLAPCLTVP